MTKAVKISGEQGQWCAIINQLLLLATLQLDLGKSKGCSKPWNDEFKQHVENSSQDNYHMNKFCNHHFQSIFTISDCCCIKKYKINIFNRYFC